MNIWMDQLKVLQIENMLTIASVVISAIALIVSIAVAWSNRKTLNVNISKDLTVVEAGTAFFADNNSEPASYDDALLLTMEVVNPSPKDIAFFDLRAFNPTTNINVNFLTRRSTALQHRTLPLWMAVDPDNEKDPKLTELNIPDANHGIFKANSFTRFSILIFPGESSEKLGFSFKVAMHAKFRKDPFAITSRKRFKFHGVIYDISSLKQSLPQSKPSEQKST